MGLFGFFYTQTYSLTSTLCFRCCLTSCVYFWPLYQNSGVQRCADLYLGLQFASPDDVSVFVPVQGCFYYYGLVVHLEIRYSDISSSSFIIMDCFNSSGLCFCMKLKIVFSKSVRNCVGISVGIALNL